MASSLAKHAGDPRDRADIKEQSAKFNDYHPPPHLTMHVCVPDTLEKVEFGELQRIIYEGVSGEFLPKVVVTLFGARGYLSKSPRRKRSLDLDPEQKFPPILIELVDVPEVLRIREFWNAMQGTKHETGYIAQWLGDNAKDYELVFVIGDGAESQAAADKILTPETAGLKLKVDRLEGTVERLLADIELLQAEILRLREK